VPPKTRPRFFVGAAREPPVFRAPAPCAPSLCAPSLSVILSRRRRISAKRLVRIAMGAPKSSRKNRPPASGCRRPVGRREASSVCADRSHGRTPSRPRTGAFVRGRIVAPSDTPESPEHRAKPDLLSEEFAMTSRASKGKKKVRDSQQDSDQHQDEELPAVARGLSTDGYADRLLGPPPSNRIIRTDASNPRVARASGSHRDHNPREAWAPVRRESSTPSLVLPRVKQRGRIPKGPPRGPVNYLLT
jgi:hypothetical protein